MTVIYYAWRSKYFAVSRGDGGYREFRWDPPVWNEVASRPVMRWQYEWDFNLDNLDELPEGVQPLDLSNTRLAE